MLKLTTTHGKWVVADEGAFDLQWLYVSNDSKDSPL